MPMTVNSDMVIYDTLAQTAYLERIQDVIEIFNAASNGAILLRNESIPGDFDKKAFYSIGGSIAHRDVNSTATVETQKVGSGEMVGVKVPYKYGPYASSEEAYKRRARDPEEFSEIVGRDNADAVLAGMIEYFTAGLRAAIGSNPGMKVAASIATHGKKTLTKGLRVFGDRSARVALWVMDSSSYFDIVDESIDNKIYNEADVVVYGGLPGTLGKPVLVTDQAPADTIFGLQPGAVIVTESQPPGFRSFPINDKENLAIGFRSEGTFNLELLGYSWNATQGGANPNLSTIGSAANWLKHAKSNKATAGVMIDLS